MSWRSLFISSFVLPQGKNICDPVLIYRRLHAMIPFFRFRRLDWPDKNTCPSQALIMNRILCKLLSIPVFKDFLLSSSSRSLGRRRPWGSGPFSSGDDGKNSRDGRGLPQGQGKGLPRHSREQQNCAVQVGDQGREGIYVVWRNKAAIKVWLQLKLSCRFR